MTKGALYFNHGTAHLARLAVSLWSLSRHWCGPVAICDTTQSSGLIDRIAECPILGDRLNISVWPVPLNRHRRNSCYCTKPTLPRYSPFDVTLLLDADTVVAADPSPLLDYAASDIGIVLTEFSNWQTTSPIIRGRIERWRGVECEGLDVSGMIDGSFARPHPAINTGVVAWRHDCEFLLAWERLTDAGWRCPFTDELAAQLLARKFPHYTVSDRWNYSPIYGRSDKPGIYHCHGSKHVARGGGRGEAGHAVWWPVWLECWDRNVGHVREWAPAGDQRLHDYMGGLALRP